MSKEKKPFPLARHSSLYQGIFESVKAVILLLDPKTSAILDANPSACVFYGYSLDHLTQLKLEELSALTPEESLEQMRILAMGDLDHLQTRHRLASGEVRDVNILLSEYSFEGRVVSIGVVTVIEQLDLELSRKEIQDHILNSNLVQSLAETSSLDNALKLCLNTALSVTKLDCGGIYIADRKSRDLNLATSVGLPDEFVEQIAHIEAGSPIWHVAMAGKAIYTVQELMRTQVPAHIVDEGYKAFVHIPLIHEGEVIACFNLASQTIDGIPPESCEMLDEIGRQAGSALVRIMAEEELRLSQTRYQSLFDQTNDAVFILDLQGRHQAVNQRAADMLGYTREEIIGLSVRDISADVEKSLKLLTHVLAGERIPPYERRFRKKDGQIIPVEINVELVRDKNGNPMHIQSVVRDISGRKGIENELQSVNELLKKQVEEVEKLQEELREQAIRDPLTGLYNRRYLTDTLSREILRAYREDVPVSLIAVDIDNFKKINDSYGHQVGDKFLVEIGDAIRQQTRGSDFVCRYGGEEFLLVLPGTTSDVAVKRAEEIRQKIEGKVMEYKGQKLFVTISLGVSTYPEHGKELDVIMIKADQALYYSKRSGRNRVTLWSRDKAAMG